MTPTTIPRPEKVQLHLLIAADDRARLAKLARATGETMSTIVRSALRRALSADGAAVE
jgi:hypothetical protein